MLAVCAVYKYIVREIGRRRRRRRRRGDRNKREPIFQETLGIPRNRCWRSRRDDTIAARRRDSSLLLLPFYIYHVLKRVILSDLLSRAIHIRRGYYVCVCIYAIFCASSALGDNSARGITSASGTDAVYVCVCASRYRVRPKGPKIYKTKKKKKNIM